MGSAASDSTGVQMKLFCRNSWAMLGGVVATATLLPACAGNAAPASLDVCKAVIKPPDGRRGYIEYYFKITNRSTRSISAVRINFQDPASLQANAVRFLPTRPLGAVDYLHAIPPHSSVTWRPRTDGLPRTPSPLHTRSLPCSVLAVRYSDGHTWSIASGILAPGEVWNPER